MGDKSGKVRLRDLPAVMVKLKAVSDMLTQDEIMDILNESSSDFNQDIDFESFLRVSVVNLRLEIWNLIGIFLLWMKFERIGGKQWKYFILDRHI